MKLLKNFEMVIVATICLLSCEKRDIGTGSQGDIKIISEVKNKVYTNDHNIKLDASKTDQINGNGQLTFSWTCKNFPNGRVPRIKDATKSIAVIDSIMAGNYNFQLSVKDNFGHEVFANYQMEVFPDTLKGAPIIVPADDLTLKLPTSVIIVDASLSAYANPLFRRLEFEWSLLQKPVGNQDPKITNQTNSYANISDLETGQYQVMVKITNELGLSSYDTIGINVLGTPITNVYEATWVSLTDAFGPGLFISISDPINFVGINNQNTKLTVLNLETQQLIDDKKYSWDISNNTLQVFYYEDPGWEGKKAKLTVRYYK